jgi:hypothetical protein
MTSDRQSVDSGQSKYSTTYHLSLLTSLHLESDSFSKANPTVLFITLSFCQICLIVQLYRSLLGGVIVFSCRLNPLAVRPPVEALLLVLPLSECVCLRIWPLGWWKRSNLNSSGMGLWEDMRLTATVVLFQRSRGSSPSYAY